MIMLRSFNDPLQALREKLLDLWDNPPTAVRDAPIIDLLRQACDRLKSKDKRLFVVIDEFEELIILHGIDAERVAPVREVLQAVGSKGNDYSALCVLLAFRSDYEGLVADLRLPPLVQDRNWKCIPPFTTQAAHEHLAGSGIQFGGQVVKTVLVEAAGVEGTRDLIRPITLNMMGRLLERFAGALPPFEAGTLLSEDIRQSLDKTNLRDHARSILRPMLTDEGTKRPRTVGQLRETTGLNPNTIEGCLLELNSLGFVRRLSQEKELATRLWEVSHDFVAGIIFQLLEAGPRKKLTQRIRPFLMPAALTLWWLAYIIIAGPPSKYANATDRAVRILSAYL